MSLNHAVIWIDHQEAHVMFLSEDASEAEVIKTKSSHSHLHHKGGEVGSGRVPFDVKYLHSVIQAVNESKEIIGFNSTRGSETRSWRDLVGRSSGDKHFYSGILKLGFPRLCSVLA